MGFDNTSADAAELMVRGAGKTVFFAIGTIRLRSQQNLLALILNTLQGRLQVLVGTQLTLIVHLE